MCSVTFWPTAEGYLLGMNRDEQRARVAALAPCQVDLGGRVVLHPSEPTGGTWIAVNDLGVVCALVNWYDVPALPVDRRISRGEVVLATRACADASAMFARLKELELSRIPPFRLIGVVPRTRTVREWRWNQRELVSASFGWEPCGWWSSGYDEPGAQRFRAATLASFREQSDAGTAWGLRRLHGSHLPEEGPYSICMHREDAATVSYTEVEVGSTFCRMRYEPGAPCRMGGRSSEDGNALGGSGEGRSNSRVSKPCPCSKEGSDGAADSWVRRGVSEERIGTEMRNERTTKSLPKKIKPARLTLLHGHG